MTCSPPPPPPTLYTLVSAESFGEEEEEESDLEGTAPTPKRRKLAREKALTNSLGSGLYPVFMGIEDPSHDANPGDSNGLDYLLLLWPATLCELIALETNRYALQRGVAKWRDVSTAEIWTFLGIVILMGIKRLPRIRNYWSRDGFIGVPGMNQCMSVTRFWAVWSNLHVVDNETCRGGCRILERVVLK